MIRILKRVSRSYEMRIQERFLKQLLGHAKHHEPGGDVQQEIECILENLEGYWPEEMADSLYFAFKGYY